MRALVVGAVVVSAILRLWLEQRQRRQLRALEVDTPPPWLDRAALERAIGAAISRSRIADIGIVAEVVGSILLVVSGLDSFHAAGQRLGVPASAAAVALPAVVLLSIGLIRRCIEIAGLFLVDAPMGLGRPPIGLLVRDTLTRLVVTSMVYVPVLAVAATLLERGEPMWWLAAWIVWLALIVVDHALRPLVQTRLFYTAQPLEDQALAARIGHLLRRSGLRLGEVQVLNASRRTRRANASLHGLGPTKHIFLHDTLLKRLGPEEVLAVVGHEVGHARHRHIPKHLAALAMLGLAGAAGLAMAVAGVQASSGERLALSALLLQPAAFLSRPALLGLSRRFEVEADAFAAAHVGASPMIRALESLYLMNAGVPALDPVYTLFHAAHPAAAERLTCLQARAGQKC